MQISELAKQVIDYYEVNDLKAERMISPMPTLTLLKIDHQTDLEATIYEPVICLILQGEKETIAGNNTIRFATGESLIVSHTLPVVSRVTLASPKEPYLAMILSIDISMLRGLYHEIGEIEDDVQQTSALRAEKTGQDVIDALSRYLALATQTIEKKILGPILLKEIHFRLLMAPHGTMLRQLLRRESYASQIDKAISHLRSNFRKPLSIVDIAKKIGMSESSFYEHFKKVTETTPLQYQKDMRLIEAQRLLRNEKMPVSSTAFEVGYESPTQFSREYARKFGVPPSKEFTR